MRMMANVSTCQAFLRECFQDRRNSRIVEKLEVSVQSALTAWQPASFVLLPKGINYTMSSDDLNAFLDSDKLPPDENLADDQIALRPVLQSLKDAGYYAYGMLDEENSWTIAADDELGRIDVRVGQDGFLVILHMSSPGLYAEEENPWRQQSRSRLARITIPRIARGFLEAHQTARWDEIDQGVAVSEHYELPFTRAGDIGAFVREQHPKLEEILTLIERQLA